MLTLLTQDHVFDPEVWARSKPVAEFGADIAFREYSVLSHPRMPKARAAAFATGTEQATSDSACLAWQQAVLESSVVVNVCTDGQPCSAEAGDGALHMNLTTPITDADAKAIFSPLSGIKVLEFTSMLGVFSGFADTADQERFYRRVKDYAGIWCCIQAHPVRCGASCDAALAVAGTPPRLRASALQRSVVAWLAFPLLRCS